MTEFLSWLTIAAACLLALFATLLILCFVPAFITLGFIGYAVAGPLGALIGACTGLIISCR